MGLDMFLFSIEKGKEKYLVDNKTSTNFCVELVPGIYDAFPEIAEMFSNAFGTPTYINDMHLERKLGGRLLPYNLVIPDCDSPDKYHQSLCYWRKSNAIHSWFINNVQGGFDDETWHKVSFDALKQLKEVCETVIAHSEIPYSVILDDDAYYSQPIKDPTVAKKLLPTVDGLFYGDTSYDGYYLEDLKDTVKKLEKILAETNFDKVTVFYNSWG